MKDINYTERQKKLHNSMEKNSIDLFLITPSVNFGYLFQGFLTISERLICGIMNNNFGMQVIAPAFERERMEIETTFENVKIWREHEDPYVVLQKSTGKNIKRIALEPSMPFEVYSRLKKVFPESEFVDGGRFIREIRSRKTEEEIERMIIAGENTKKGMLSAVQNLEEGLTELEVLKMVQNEMSELSGEPSWALVQFDENSAIPHGHPSKKKLKQNSVVLIDAGTMCEHYFADITLTTVFGKPSKEFLKVYKIVEKANEKALKTSKDGIPAEAVDFAARDVIVSSGYGKYFTHRLGHGLGLEVHEEPYIVKGNSNPLKTGNVHTDEPGIYLLGKFGIRIEDDILVEGARAKKLVNFDRYLWK